MRNTTHSPGDELLICHTTPDKIDVEFESDLVHQLKNIFIVKKVGFTGNDPLHSIHLIQRS